MRKKLLFVMFLFMMLMVFPKTAYADFPQKTVDSTVVILSEISYQGQRYEEYDCWGTGFFVGEIGEKPKYIVTNYHVIEYYQVTHDEDGQSRLYIVYGQGDSEEGYLVAYDKDKDIAILHVADPCTKRKPLGLRIPDDSMVGNNVYTVGFPAISEYTFEHVSSFGKDDVTVTTGILSRMAVESGKGRKVIQTDAEVNSGNSGGPLVDDEGYAIGVNTFISLDPDTGDKVAGVNYAVSTESLIPLLESNSVPYFEYPEGMPKTNIILIIAIVGVVVVGILIGVIVGVSKKNSDKNHPQPIPPQPIPPQPVPPQPVPPQSVPPMIPKASVSSYAPQHNGLTVPVNSPIMIGRADGCAIKFSPDTPSISRNHCQISYDPIKNEFTLNDLKSSYGTFLSTGYRIPANTPYHLKPGDSFYLGVRENSFTLRVER